jgi:hypothetical protein
MENGIIITKPKNKKTRARISKTPIYVASINRIIVEVVITPPQFDFDILIVIKHSLFK